MIRKYHNHKLQTNPWHRKEDPHNTEETPGRQTKPDLSNFITYLLCKSNNYFVYINIKFMSCSVKHQNKQINIKLIL